MADHIYFTTITAIKYFIGKTYFHYLLFTNNLRNALISIVLILENKFGMY